MKKAKSLLSVLLTCIIALSIFTLAFADTANVAETEPNDNKAQATVFDDANGTATGSISGHSDTDYFKFKATNSGLAFLTVTMTGGDDYKVTVENDSGSPLAGPFVASGTSADSSYFTIMKDSEYYIKVEANSVVTGGSKYTLEITETSKLKMEAEPNSEFATANAFTMDTNGNSDEIYGSVSGADVDFFSFKANAGYTFIDLKKMDNQSGEVVVEVFHLKSSDKEHVAKFSTSDPFVSSKNNFERSADIGTKGEVYYVKVSGNGAYSLRVYTRISAENESEYNNDFAYANSFTASARRFGNLSATDDVDFFKITTTDADKNIAIVVTADTSAGDSRNDPEGSWNVEVFNSEKKSVGSGNVPFAKPAEINIASEGAGTFYIKVTASNYSKGAYIVSTKKVDAPQENLSLWERIKALDWAKFWKENSFGELMNNIDVVSVFKSLFQLSFGTIGTWIAQLIASRA